MARKDISDLQVVLAYRKSKLARTSLSMMYPYDFLMEETGQSFKVCYRAMERADKRGLIDYGVSLRTGWLTEKGLELLETSLCSV